MVVGYTRPPRKRRKVTDEGVCVTERECVRVCVCVEWRGVTVLVFGAQSYLTLELRVVSLFVGG